MDGSVNDQSCARFSHCCLHKIMSSHSYEVALFGEFFSQDLKPILNRITLHSEASQPFQSREIVFEPLDAQLQRDSGTEPILLRAKKDISEPKAPWSVDYCWTMSALTDL